MLRNYVPAEYHEVVEFGLCFDDGHGTCICGRDVQLWDQYYGACQCECGRWYNLFGQELLPPEQWERDPAEEEYW